MNLNALRLDELSSQQFGTPRFLKSFDQIFGCGFTHKLSFPIPGTSLHPRVSAGRGVRRDPPGEARDCMLRRYGGSTLCHLRAVVFEDFQIAN